MALPAPHHRHTPQEYLSLEEAALDKHEYHAGEILAMSGGNYRHSRTIANLIRSVGNRLSGSPCFVLESNMRVRLARDDRYVYPDASIVCGEPIFDPLDKKQTTIINPTAIIEVLSPSTEGYDRGDKFTAYRTLDSLTEYVLVSTTRPSVETFFRQADGTWLFDASIGVGAVARLRSMSVELPLVEIFDGLAFEPGQSSPEASVSERPAKE